MESVWINGSFYKLEDYKKDSRIIDLLPEFEKEILSFIDEWRSGKDTFNFRSSGSTGKPKKITLHRDQMIASAESTLHYLNISTGGKALLCLDPRYIAGKMVIVRSFIGNMELFAINPTANPLSENKIADYIDLASFVPYQVVGILKHSYSLSEFKRIKNILIGGAAISQDLERQLKPLENKVWHSFGMTETVSHIALKILSGRNQSPYYKILPGISIGCDSRGCLTVKGKITQGDTIITNDLVDIKGKNEFVWKGRIDQVINSGGIKININLLEFKIREIFEAKNLHNDFFIDHLADEKLGEKIILIVESGSSEIDVDMIKEVLMNQLTKYEMPKKIFVIPRFVLTDSGKVNRRLCLNQIPGKLTRD